MKERVISLAAVSGISLQGVMGRRIETRDPKRRIVTAARKLFGRKGYSGTSVREIIRASNVARSALYYHFVNKRALYVALVMDAIETVRVAIRPNGEETNGMTERLKVLFERLDAVLVANPDAVRLLTAHFNTPSAGGFDEIHEDLKSDIDALVDDVLRLGLRDGTLRNGDLPGAQLIIQGLLRSMGDSRAEARRGRRVRPPIGHYMTALDLAFGNGKSS